jgi:hypothetical protein
LRITLILRQCTPALASFVLLVWWLADASMASAQVRRVPAEWEPQEALWLQWPGPYEQTYVSAYAAITNVVVNYQPAVRSGRIGYCHLHSAQKRFHPCDNFSWTKGFTNVVVRTNFEPDQSIDFVYAGGHHDDRHL